MGKLTDFAGQFDAQFCGKYKYIEHPRPLLKYLEESQWRPHEEDLATVHEFIRKRGVFRHYAYFYHKDKGKYYVIDHLWLGLMAAVGPVEMQRYLSAVFSKTLKKSHTPPVVVKASSKQEKGLVVDVVDNEGKSTLKRKEKSVSYIQKLKEKVAEESYIENYGFSKQVLTEMAKDCHKVPGKEWYYIGTITKYLYQNEQIDINVIYNPLKKAQIISQPPMPNWHTVWISKSWIDQGLAKQVPNDEKGTNYPHFSERGLIQIGLELKEAGVIDKPILPKHLVDKIISPELFK